MSRVHPVFHGNILKRYKEYDHRRFPGGKHPATGRGNQDEVEGQMFEIDSIIDKDVVKVKGKTITKYRVRWKGYKAEDDSWLEYSDQDPDWQEDKQLVINWERDQTLQHGLATAQARKKQRGAGPSKRRPGMKKVKGSRFDQRTVPRVVRDGVEPSRRRPGMQKVPGSRYDRSRFDQRTVQGSRFIPRTVPRAARDVVNKPPAPGSWARPGLRTNPRTTPRVSWVLSKESQLDNGIGEVDSPGRPTGEIQSTSLLRSTWGCDSWGWVRSNLDSEVHFGLRSCRVG
jgi:hypothetical protein